MSKGIFYYGKRLVEIFKNEGVAGIAGRAYVKLTGKAKKSALALKLCEGSGLEIGGAMHNDFGLKTLNVDYTDAMTIFKEEEVKLCGKYMPVDIVSAGDNIPVEDGSFDFIINSHVIEHFLDPMKALLEWHRIVKKGGIIFIIAPHKERTFDKDRPRTTLKELIDRHAGRTPLKQDTYEHFSVWITQDLLELVIYMNNNGIFPEPVAIEAVQDTDDKVGNGFTVVLRKQP